MHHPLGVRLADRVADLQRDAQRPHQIHRPARRGERALEREAVEVLHDDVQRAVRQLTGEVHLDHVRMRQPRGDLGLAMEARHQLRVRAELAVQDLHRDVTIDPPLVRAVHPPHRTDAGELLQLDVPEHLAPEVRIVAAGVAPARRVSPCIGQRRAVLGTEKRLGGVAGAACHADFGG